MSYIEIRLKSGRLLYTEDITMDLNRIIFTASNGNKYDFPCFDIAAIRAVTIAEHELINN